MSHAKLFGACFHAQSSSAAKAPLHFTPGFTAASQSVTQFSSAQESDDSRSHTAVQGSVRSGSPVVGPSFQQFESAVASAVQTPDVGWGCPFVSHVKLVAGSLA